jgi:hypothetical protein
MTCGVVNGAFPGGAIVREFWARVGWFSPIQSMSGMTSKALESKVSAVLEEQSRISILHKLIAQPFPR